jgi:hypothetical protein
LYPIVPDLCCKYKDLVIIRHHTTTALLFIKVIQMSCHYGDAKKYPYDEYAQLREKDQKTIQFL